MELSTGAMVEETSPLRVQEIEIRHTKQFALLSWSRNTSGEKTVKFFLGGCWCALPVWPEISSPQGEVRVVTDEAIRSRDTSLALSGPQLLSEIPTQLPLWAMEQKDRSFPCCGLPGCIWRRHSLHRHRLYLLPQGNESMRADQDMTGVS